MRYRKHMASICADASLGLIVTTPEALIEELWDVWGSRERIVSATQRTLMVSALLEQRSTWVCSAGTVSLLTGFLRDFIAYLGPDFCEMHQAVFTSSDNEIISFVRAYEDKLVQVGLIEPAQATRHLAQVVHLPDVIVRTQQPLPAFMCDFLQRVAETYRVEEAQTGVSMASAGESGHLFALPPDRSYLLLKPKGQTAVAYMIAEVLEELNTGAKALVTAPDPLALFALMSEALVKQGFVVSAKALRPFANTFFGRAFNAVALLCNPPREASLEAVLQAAAVYIESPYAQLSPLQRSRLVQTMRADRTLGAFEICESLRAASHTFEYFEALTEESEADILFGLFEDLAHRLSLEDSEVACELAILARMKVLYREARKLGRTPRSFLDLVDALMAPFEHVVAPEDFGGPDTLVPFAEAAGDNGRRVHFTTFEDASSYPAECCEMSVMTSLDSMNYSGAEHRSTLTEFLNRYRLPYQDDTLAGMERAFARVVRASSERVVFEYAEQDMAGNECYPAFFLESFLNERKIAGKSVEERLQGEEEFDLAARIAPLDQTAILRVAPVVLGDLTEVERAQLITYTYDAEGIERPVLSPSAIELYRKCPYRWFVERKLHLDDAGERFGSREKGLFAHSVFQTFYEQWAERGYDRVSPHNFDEAQALFSKVFDRVVDAQVDASPGNRYVAISELEREEITRLKRQLLSSLSFQQYLFPQYHVRGHEVAILPDDKIVYAGAILQGRIDRIDVDEQGDLIVIDYKGSTLHHDAGFVMPDEDEPYEAPDKVQALMYAQALRYRYPDLHPKAAVYLSYRAKVPKEVLAGSLLESLAESTSYSKKANVVEGNFESFLDRIECDLTTTVERMKLGDIAPDPRNDRACDHCPVLYCEKRVNGS